MENYIVSARKYRPATFASVVGQAALTSTLKNAIATSKLAHAYLFCGSRGVGKTSCARIFAKAINCTNPTPDGDPCNECDSCRAFNDGASLNIVELDAASNNGVEDIRALVDQVQIPPTNGRYRVFIIDEVHMLSSQAFNAFLKTLEEPPSYVIFILATTEKHKIIPTILSRCQIFDFNRITIRDMVDHLEWVASQEGITAERKALGVIASKADGAMRDALSIFDQVAASSRGNITYRSTVDNLNVLDSAYYGRLLDAFVESDVPKALLAYKDVRDHGFGSQAFINGLAAFIRDLMVAQNPSTVALLDTDEETAAALADMSKRVTPQFLYKAMSLCNDADLNYRTASNKNFLTELLLIKLCQLLSPSPIFSGDGEGQLKPLLPASPAVAAAATPSPQHQPAAQPVAAQPVATQISPTAPQPVATQPVATQPTAATEAAAPRTRHAAPRSGSRLLHTIRINVPEESAASDAAVTAADNTPRDNAYTPGQVVQAWNAFAAEIPTEVLLVNTMRASQPVAAEGDTFTITVENPMQSERLELFMPRLLKFIHDSTGNDYITFEIKLNDGATNPSTWTEREVFNHLMENHGQFRKFVQDFKLSLI